uniref:PID domain-containing protein n=1 Tax=Gongylonema pulchrum TaxID=637853 RepID=A0A183E1V2_9BILA
LLNGRVEYSVKMLGFTEVTEPKGTHVIRDAIHAIRFQLQVNRGITGHSGSKLKKVDLQISVDGLTIIDSKTKMILFKYPLHRISFCADDKQDKRVFSFIAKAESSSRHDCFVFLSEKLAEQITLAVGEAFDLAYQKFLEKNGRDLENRKQLIVLRKRIEEPVPPLPSTPMPREPPPGIATNEVIPAIVPPPMIPRRHHVYTAVTNNEPSDANAPQRKKAAEAKNKDKFGLDPFGDDFMNDVLSLEAKPKIDAPSGSSEHEPTPEQFDEMLSMVDKRLTELRDGFASGLAMGDTGDSARDLHTIYSIPTQSPEASAGGDLKSLTNPSNQNGHT